MVSYVKRQEAKDKAYRKQNLIIKGLVINSNLNDAHKAISELLETRFNLQTTFSNLEVLGKDKNVLKIKMNSLEDKYEIMMNKKSALKGTKIFIENDLTEAQARDRWNLRNAVKCTRQSSKSVRYYQDKVNIDGNWLTWDENSRELVPTQPPLNKNRTSKANTTERPTSKN